jgi:hypothetical protein
MITIVISAIACGESYAEKDTEAPIVIATFPSNGSADVDPLITEISVTFSEEMQDGNWSWAYTNKSQFPEMTGDPSYTENYTKNTLPVKLEPNKEYEIWINSQKFKNFKDKSGNPAIPFRLVFKTR